MKNTISIAISLVTGIVIGVAATYKIAETKYRNIADEEIASVVDRFIDRKPLDKDTSKTLDTMKQRNEEDESQSSRFTTSKNSMAVYKSEVERIGYDQISTQNVKPKRGKKKKDEVVVVEEDKPNDGIYVISPDEFDTVEGYEKATLYYSVDNYVLDSDLQVLSDPEIKRLIDHDPLGNFGEYEDDSAYIRNEELMCDFEILQSEKTCLEIQEG